MDEKDEQRITHADAIARGVYTWLEANKKEVLSVVDMVVQAAINKWTETAIEMMAQGVMYPWTEFLRQNSDEITTKIAAACATSWVARQHSAKQ